MAGDNKADVSSLQSFVFSELYKGVLEESGLHNIQTQLISPPFFDTFPNDEEMDLIILQNVPTHLEELTERLVSDKNINCVCCHSLETINGMSTVRSARREGAYDAVSYLINKGCQKIAFIGGGNPVWTQGRFDGYYQALKDNGINFDMRMVCNVELNKEEQFETMDKLMKHEEAPDAVFCVSDADALFVLEYCREHGVKVPDDLAVASVDNTPESAHTKPALTTVDTMLAEQGREAVRLLLERFPKGQTKDKILKNKLIVRESA